MKQGSSLILVLLVIAGVVSAVVVTERIALVQSSQVQSSADNTYAYNAAKAGIEDGLLRYRYNRNVETVDSTGTQQTYRFDLSTGQVVNSSSPLTSKDEYYDLNIGFKTQAINIDNNGNIGSNTNILAQDQGVTLTGFTTGTTISDYFLRYYFAPANGCSDPNFSVQVQAQLSSGGVKEYHLVPTESSGVIDSADPSAFPIDINSTPTITSLTVMPLGCSVTYGFTTTKQQHGKGNVDIGPAFDSLTTTITSTGYYGNAKRTFIATIDRTTGQLINIYDFTAYSGQGNISP